MTPSAPGRAPAEADSYAATAAAYGLFAGPDQPNQLAALESMLSTIDPTQGPLLDVGAGPATIAGAILDRVPDLRVLALEPSRAMRALALTAIAARPDWHERITLRPEDFFSATLPHRISGAILLGVIGHFDPGERAAVLAELAHRLPVGARAVLDLQAPETPERVEPYAFTVATVGDLQYRGIAEAWPLDGEAMRWRMTYLTLDGERVVVEDVAEFTYHHPAPDVVRKEAADVGLDVTRIGETRFWCLTRRA